MKPDSANRKFLDARSREYERNMETVNSTRRDAEESVEESLIDPHDQLPFK